MHTRLTLVSSRLAGLCLGSSLSLTLAACGASSAAPESAAPSQQSAGAEVVEKLAAPLMVKDVGFETPESVLYDAVADVYLVSNIKGSPLDADDKAFISRVAPDGNVLELKWIDSESPEVTLDAPKGLALVGDVLYVADLTFVRKFDRVSGKPLGSIKIEGSTFLNDIAAAADGSVYVSDSGLTTGFAPSGTDALVRIGKDDKVSPVVKDVALGRPNGLLASADGVWVVTFGSGELYRVDGAGKREDIKKLPKGSLDGIIQAGSEVLISSWEASAVYQVDGDAFREVVSGLDAPADIGIDTKRNRVLVPLFNQNALSINQL